MEKTEKAKRKAARKTLLVFRVSPEEQKMIAEAAAAEHIKTSSWVRRLVLLTIERRERDRERAAAA